MPTKISAEIPALAHRQAGLLRPQSERSGRGEQVLPPVWAQALNPFKGFHNDFKALMEDEDKIVHARASSDWCYAYITDREPGEFTCWVEGHTTESLQERWKLLATEAGIELGSPRGASPSEYWLHQLFLGLRANKSDYARMYSDTDAVIERVIEASATFCILSERRSLEKTMMPNGDFRLEPSTARPTPIAQPEQRRGYRTEVQKWMAREAVGTIEVAARRLHIDVSALKSIMSKRGKCRYGEATLGRILGMIGYQGE